MDTQKDVDKIMNDLEKDLKALKELIINPKTTGANAGKGKLYWSWHYLQVYSTWGLRLAHDEKTLKTQLGISNPGAYSFFTSMVDAYKSVYDTCKFFNSNVLSSVIQLGNNLKTFAKDAGGISDGYFKTINDLVTDDPRAALDLITDLKDQAAKNAEAAKKVQQNLIDYKSQLTEAQSNLTKTRGIIESDDATSLKTIEKLTGGENVEGSILNLQKLASNEKAEYDHDVVVASTTVTYFWVLPPIGLIAAVPVAGVFGKKAVDMLEEYNRTIGKISAAQTELFTAIAARKVHATAETGISNALSFTDLAIDQTTTIQNAWNGILTNLDEVAQRIESMVTETDQGLRLKSVVTVKFFSNKAADAWKELIEPLNSLTAKPYITVENDEKSIKDLIEAINKELAEG